MREKRLILILTSGSPATNPRMVKEANELVKRGFHVHVLYGFIVDWADDLDFAIIKAAGWTAERVGGHPVHDQLPWILTRIVQRVAQIFRHRGFFSFCLSRLSLPLYLRGRKITPRAIIAHNLGALPAARRIARKSSVPLFFDAEDLHSEESMSKASNELARNAEAKFFPHCTAISAASPLIGEAYAQRFPELSIFTVNNCFSIKDQVPLTPILENRLRFAWFSQTIGKDRGLIEFLTAASQIQHPIPLHLTLVGACSSSFHAQLQQIIQFCSHIELVVKPPMSEKEIMKLLKETHVGLALENSQPLNRDLCLTNKVFSYLLNGCQILYSETSGQVKFLADHSMTGRLVNLHDSTSIQDGINWFLQNFDELNQLRLKNWQLANEKLNFEYDAANWMKCIESKLNP